MAIIGDSALQNVLPVSEFSANAGSRLECPLCSEVESKCMKVRVMHGHVACPAF